MHARCTLNFEHCIPTCKMSPLKEKISCQLLKYLSTCIWRVVKVVPCLLYSPPLSQGFMWDIAPEFKAMLVFAEHRYYGTSMPYGKDSYKVQSHLFMCFLASPQTNSNDYIDSDIHEVLVVLYRQQRVIQNDHTSYEYMR